MILILSKEIRELKFGSFLEDKELVIKENRRATVELRVQSRLGIGDPTAYTNLVDILLQSKLDLEGLRFVSSSSSLSIQAKDINKGNAFLRALKLLDIDRKDVFVIGLGDAENDQEIFQEADLGIAVRNPASHMADLFIDGGDKTALQIMRYVS